MNTLDTPLLRPGHQRGHTRIDWLDSYHTFSFGDYVDSQFHHFSDLRVINDDRIQPGGGFATHGHRDMEIITVVLKGELSHQDSLGNGSTIRPGEIQRMSAGTGVLHSEFNPSNSEELHLLQIWIHPDERGLPPSYEQKSWQTHLKTSMKNPQTPDSPFVCIGSPSGEGTAVRIHQDAWLYRAELESAQKAEFTVQAHRQYWLHVATGEVSVSQHRLQAGDALGIRDQETLLRFTAHQPQTQLLWFDLRKA